MLWLGYVERIDLFQKAFTDGQMPLDPLLLVILAGNGKPFPLQRYLALGQCLKFKNVYGNRYGSLIVGKWAMIIPMRPGHPQILRDLLNPADLIKFFAGNDLTSGCVLVALGGGGGGGVSINPKISRPLRLIVN